MAEFGCIRRPDETATPDLAGLTYLTEDVRTKLQCLPGFATVTDWSKNWRGVPVHFTFMNLLLYLVCGRDKTFDMHPCEHSSPSKLIVFSQNLMGLSAMSDCMTVEHLSQG